jgi:hypothetical protein
MIVNLSITHSPKPKKSLQQYNYYTAFKVIAFGDYDSDDENDSINSTIPRDALEQRNKKIILQSNSECSSKTIKKYVRFHDSVESFPSLEPELTEEEKRNAWYSIHELQTMKKQMKLYAKFISTIDSTIMDDLLNDMSFNVDDNINDDEIICLRGLEKYLKGHSSGSSSARRRMLVQNVLLEQRRQRRQANWDDNNDEDYVISSNEEQIRNMSKEISKICQGFASQIAQKSYCIPACGF